MSKQIKLSPAQEVLSKKFWLSFDPSDVRCAGIKLEVYQDKESPYIMATLNLSDEYSRVIFDFCITSPKEASNAIDQLNVIRYAASALLKSIKATIEQGALDVKNEQESEE